MSLPLFPLRFLRQGFDLYQFLRRTSILRYMHIMSINLSGLKVQELLAMSLLR